MGASLKMEALNRLCATHWPWRELWRNCSWDRHYFGLSQSKVSIPAQLSARVRVAWMGAGLRGGVHLVSLYLVTGGALTEENLALLEHVAAILDMLDGP